jgi:hypothetical protein
MGRTFESQAEFMQRLKEVMAQEAEDHPRTDWMYLSFAGEEDFNGGVIVKAHGIAHAVYIATNLGINPHGEVVGHFIPAEMMPDMQWVNRLLTLDQLKEFWPDMERLSVLEKEGE